MRRVIGLAFVCVFIPSIVFADRFIRTGEIVYDTKTKLKWQSKVNGKQINRNDAISYCEAQGLDWRLPNLYELKSLIDHNKYNFALATDLINFKIKDKYNNSFVKYWTSSQSPSGIGGENSWIINIITGESKPTFKSAKVAVLCVQ